MNELTPEEAAVYLAKASRKTYIRNWWKNLSRFWSPSERRLQRTIRDLHEEMDANLTKFGE